MSAAIIDVLSSLYCGALRMMYVWLCYCRWLVNLFLTQLREQSQYQVCLACLAEYLAHPLFHYPLIHPPTYSFVHSHFHSYLLSHSCTNPFVYSLNSLTLLHLLIFLECTCTHLIVHSLTLALALPLGISDAITLCLQHICKVMLDVSTIQQYEYCSHILVKLKIVHLVKS